MAAAENYHDKQISPPAQTDWLDSLLPFTGIIRVLPRLVVLRIRERALPAMVAMKNVD
jgi:hypothetical protein